MTTQSPGLFIAFEGGDGAGKSTQAAELAAALVLRGRKVLQTREPGGTPIGEKLRSLVLDHGHGHIDAHTEALIFAASRAAHASQVIRPALERDEKAGPLFAHHPSLPTPAGNSRFSCGFPRAPSGG